MFGEINRTHLVLAALMGLFPLASLALAMQPEPDPSRAHRCSPSGHSSYPLPFPTLLDQECTQPWCADPNAPAGQTYYLPGTGSTFRFAGRFLDQEGTQAGKWASPGFQMPFASGALPAVERDRIYIHQSSMIAPYDLSTFVTGSLQQPLIESYVSSCASSMAHTEWMLPWDSLIYPNFSCGTDSCTGGWPYRTTTIGVISEIAPPEPLNGPFDYDERGYLYLNYANQSVPGMAMVLDNGRTGQLPVSGFWQEGNVQVAVRVADKHYVLSSSRVMDATDPSQLRVVAALSNFFPASPFPAPSVAKLRYRDEHWVAVAYPQGEVRITRASRIIAGGSPSPDSSYLLNATYGGTPSVTTDGISFYAVAYTLNPSNAYEVSAKVVQLKASIPGDPTSFVAREFPIPGLRMTPKSIRYGAGYLTVVGTRTIELCSGCAPTGYDQTRLFKLTATGLQEIDLGNFFERYYGPPEAEMAFSNPGRRYLVRRGSTLQDSVVYRAGGKAYLVQSYRDKGDVYEIIE